MTPLQNEQTFIGLRSLTGETITQDYENNVSRQFVEVTTLKKVLGMGVLVKTLPKIPYLDINTGEFISPK
ncbi:MAG TPA: hypothetical protein V6C96_01685 [Vampirovibrionales bacterium]